ncbi:MAG: hypothetical protein K2X25_11215 [Caulobacteraceae bacterium]|nr:hypothetical protein [Caulobacteraceae bacterium]
MFKFDVAAIIRAVGSPIQLIALGIVLGFLLVLCAMARAHVGFPLMTANGTACRSEAALDLAPGTRAPR